MCGGGIFLFVSARSYMQRSEDNLGCWFLPSTLFETWPLLHKSGWMACDHLEILNPPPFLSLWGCKDYRCCCIWHDVFSGVRIFTSHTFSLQFKPTLNFWALRRTSLSLLIHLVIPSSLYFSVFLVTHAHKGLMWTFNTSLKLPLSAFFDDIWMLYSI